MSFRHQTQRGGLLVQKAEFYRKYDFYYSIWPLSCFDIHIIPLSKTLRGGDNSAVLTSVHCPDDTVDYTWGKE